ncbi:MAG TPA: hypothetical protein VK709_12925 [Candidatus Saccharimonadales bacterium]|jgi:hypothetical protein|nr:hypothetical protein [Candidatus Saccharimonadales bacterium]
MIGLSGAGFSLRGLILAKPKPRRLKPAPLKSTRHISLIHFTRPRQLTLAHCQRKFSPSFAKSNRSSREFADENKTFSFASMSAACIALIRAKKRA